MVWYNKLIKNIKYNYIVYCKNVSALLKNG